MPRPCRPRLSFDTYRLVAHRGAHNTSKGIIENTLKAFERAYILGCFGIELDIHQTSDGIFVVHHDPDLQRLWHKKGLINDMTFAALRKEIPNIPTLEEVVNAYGKKMCLFIELKSDGIDETKLKSILSPLIEQKDYFLLSLNLSFLEKLSLFSKKTLLPVAVQSNTKLFLKSVLSEGYGGLLGHYLLLNRSMVEKLLTAKKHIGTGFIDSKNLLYREFNRGVPWIFSNNVEELSRFFIKKN